MTADPVVSAGEVIGQPFPGLRPFLADEAHLYFGREKQTDELLRRLRRHRFTAVVGSSGSGKSSLVRAGLLPALAGGYLAEAGSRWRIAVMRPGANPIRNLATELAQPGVLGAAMPKDWPAETVIEATLRRSALGLIEATKQARLDPGENLLVVADQFEELFRLHRAGQAGADEEAAGFVKLLLEAIHDPGQPIYILLTIRLDFLGHCPRFRGLPEALNEGQYLVPRLTRNQIREAIVGPVAVGGADIAPRLVQRILNDGGDDPDQLPVLQHAMMRTWDYALRRSQPPKLDIADYELAGGLQKALENHAEDCYRELKTPQRQRIARIVFQALSEKQPDQPETRRLSPLGEIRAIAGASEDDVIEVINAFRQEGRTFLMPPPGEKLKSDSVIDISHEALIRLWGRLRSWVAEEAESRLAITRILDASQRYEAGESSLWRDPELKKALAWKTMSTPNEAWVRRYVPNQPEASYHRAMKFLDRSRRARLWSRIVSVTMVAVVVSFVVVWAAQWVRSKQAEVRSKQADLEKATTEIAKKKDQGEVKDAALASYRVLQSKVESQVTMFVRDKKDEQQASILKELGFEVKQPPPVGRGAATNAIWFGKQVPVPDVKLAANALIQAGVQLYWIRPFALTSPRSDSNFIQIGSDPVTPSCTAWTAEKIAVTERFTRAGCATPGGAETGSGSGQPAQGSRREQ